MNIVIKANSNYSESLGAIDLTAPDTVLILCCYNEIHESIMSIFNQIYRQYDLSDAIITLCYTEEPWWQMLEEIPLVGICHLFMEEHNLCPSNLIFSTGNFYAPDMYRDWREENNKPSKSSIDLRVCYTHWDRWSMIQKKDYYTTHKKNRHYKYVNLNGNYRWQRSELLNYLWYKDFLDFGRNSCHYDDIIPRRLSKLRADHLPTNSHHLDQSHLYDTTYFSILSETCFDESEGGITEKTYKTFYYRHPFIMVSSPGTLAILHELGFKTFDGLIDESYDNISDQDERLDAIKKEIHKLCSMSNEELHQWHHSLNDIYDHNQNLLYQWGREIQQDRPRLDH